MASLPSAFAAPGAARLTEPTAGGRRSLQPTAATPSASERDPARRQLPDGRRRQRASMRAPLRCAVGVRSDAGACAAREDDDLLSARVYAVATGAQQLLSLPSSPVRLLSCSRPPPIDDEMLLQPVRSAQQLRRCEPGSSPGRADPPRGASTSSCSSSTAAAGALCQLCCPLLLMMGPACCALVLLLSVPCNSLTCTALCARLPVLQEQEGRRHKGKIQEWPFAGVSLSRVLGRMRRVSAVCICRISALCCVCVVPSLCGLARATRRMKIKLGN